jgi:hypothetical protein
MTHEFLVPVVQYSEMSDVTETPSSCGLVVGRQLKRAYNNFPCLLVIFCTDVVETPLVVH